MSPSLRVPSLLLLLFAVQGLAQESPRLRPQQDTELWLSTAVEFKPLKKRKGKVYQPQFMKRLRAYVEASYRGNENITASKVFFTTVGARYKLNDHVAFGMDARYNFRDRYTTNSTRLDGQVTLSHEVGRIAGSYRVNLQHELIEPFRIRTVLRHRFELEWNTRKMPIDPVVSAETFTALNYKGNTLIGVRYQLGIKYRPDKVHSIDLAYQHDRELNTAYPRYRHIIAISYGYYLK